MPEFRYHALDADQQLVSGTIEAERVSDAIEHLESAGLKITSISYAAAGTNEAQERSRPVRPAQLPVDEEAFAAVEQRVLQSHIAKILGQARPIAPALRAYAEELPSRSRQQQLRAVAGVLEEADSGKATSTLQALPEYWLPLLSAVSSTNDPGRVLREFLTETQRTEEVGRQRWQTFAYPALLLFLATLVLTALSVLVVPMFERIFSDFGVRLPSLTRFVLSAARWIASGLPLLIIVVVSAMLLFLHLRKRLRPASRGWFDGRVSTPYRRATALARLSYFLADLLEGGLEIRDALRVAGFATGWSRLRTAAWQFANEGRLSPGQTRSYEALTATILYTLSADMPRPSRIRLLREIGLCYAERARQTDWWARGLLEPLVICSVGMAVGIVVLALFLPLVHLITTLTG